MNPSIFSTLWGLLVRSSRSTQLYGTMLLNVAAAVLEVVSFLSLAPLMSLVLQPGLLLSNQRLASALAYSRLDEAGFISLLGGLVVALLLSGMLASLIASYATNQLVQHVRLGLATTVLKKSASSDLEVFYSLSLAEYQNMVFSESSRVANGVILPFFVAVSRGFVVFLLIGCSVWVAGPRVLIMFGLISALAGLIYLNVRKYLARYGARSSAAYQRAAGAFNETMANFKVMKTAHLERFFTARFETAFVECARADGFGNALSQAPRFLLEGLTLSAIALVIVALTNGPGDMRDQVPALAVLLVSAAKVLPTLNNISQCFASIKLNHDALANVMSYIDKTPEPTNSSLTDLSIDAPSCRDLVIQLKNISYTYPGSSAPALDDVSLEIYAGEKLAIVGESGAGKSTILDAIAGLLPIRTGSISYCVHGKACSRGDVRIGYAPQRAFLIDASLAENILLARITPNTEEALREAIEIAQLISVVTTLPGGLNTPVNDGDKGLSGGQAQRVGIARAIFGRPPIILLDEATSALDPTTEAAFIERLLQVFREETLIVVTHRWDLADKMDRTLLVRQGKLIEGPRGG